MCDKEMISRGRPRRAWMDHVNDDTAAPLDSLMCLAADRQAWTSFRYGPRVDDDDEHRL